MKRLRIFISYARAEGSVAATRYYDALTLAGMDVWMDTAAIARGAVWSQEIEAAIRRCDVMLALITSESDSSYMCLAERLHAVGLGKAVVPVRVEPMIPLPWFLSPVEAVDDPDPERLVEALRKHRKKKPYKQSRHEYVTAPPLPPHYVPRPDVLDEVRRAIIQSGADRALIAFAGMGGSGKSTLMNAVCHDTAVRAAFPDGVVWVDIVDEPAGLGSAIDEVVRALGGAPARGETIQQSRNRLRTMLHGKRALLLLDNVWRAETVELFRTDSPHVRVLFTTRDEAVAIEVGAACIPVPMMKESQAVALLQQWAGRDDKAFGQVAARLRCHPLAVKLAGALMMTEKDAATWLRLLPTTAELSLSRYSSEPNQNLTRSFDLSFERLPDSDRALYFRLGALPPRIAIPERVVTKLWRCDERECQALLGEFQRLALIERQADGVMLHDLLYDYARSRLGNSLRTAANDLVTSYNPGAEPWADVPDDGYLYHYLGWHLVDAARSAELAAMLLDFTWLRRKLEACSASALIADYRLIPSDSALQLIREALELCAYVIGADPAQLSSQLRGRLSFADDPAVRSLLESIPRLPGTYDLQPITSSLIPPASGLLRTFAGHRESVWAVAATSDTKRIVTASQDGTVRVWDTETGAEIMSFEIPYVRSIAIVPDDTRVVAGSVSGEFVVLDLRLRAVLVRTQLGIGSVRVVTVSGDSGQALIATFDGTIALVDLESGETVRTLPLSRRISSLAASADQALVVAGHEDGAVTLCDVRAGDVIDTVKRHAAEVTAVALARDGSLVLSGSEDGGVCTWDIASGSVHPFRADPRGVFAVAFTRDERNILTGGVGGSVRIWDARTRTLSSTLMGHSGWVSEIFVTDDGRAVTGSDDRTARLWDVGASSSMRLGTTVDMAVILDRERVVTAQIYGPAAVWDIRTGQPIGPLRAPVKSVAALAANPANGTLLIAPSDDSPHDSPVVWDSASNSQRCRLVGHEKRVSAVAVSPNGRCALTVGHDDTVKLWDLRTGNVLASVPSEEWTLGVGFLPGCRQAFLVFAEAPLEIIDLPTMKRRYILGDDLGEIGTGTRTALPLADGNHLLTVTFDKRVLLWNLPTRSVVREFVGHDDYVTDVAVSPCGRFLCTSSDDRTARVWDLERGARVATFTGDAALHACVWDSSGVIVVAGATEAVHFLRFSADPVAP